MKKFTTLLLLAFFSLLASAQAESNSPSTFESAQTEQEIIVTPVGFDKVLSLILFDVEGSQVEVEITQDHTGFAFKTSLRVIDTEVLEMDLSDFEGGTYTLSLTAGDYTQTQTVIFP